MSYSTLITAGTPGLVLADFGFRFYRNGASDLATPTTLTLTDLLNGDYLVGALPDVRGAVYTLTWEYPPGAGAAHYYPDQSVDPSAIPSNVVLPIRDTGLTTSDIDLTLYLDGVETADVLALTELNTGAGDYLVAGWPTTTPTAGTYTLVWRYGGLSYSFTWTVPTTPARCQIVTDLLDMFGDTAYATPGTRDGYGAFTPSGTILTLPCRIEGAVRTLRLSTGQELTSTVQLIIAGAYDLTTDQHQYTIPSRYNPRTNIDAIKVDKIQCEDGEAYESVWLP